jgi:hypothetical protein
VRAAVAAPISGPAGISSAPVRKDERGFVLNEVSLLHNLRNCMTLTQCRRMRRSCVVPATVW